MKINLNENFEYDAITNTDISGYISFSYDEFLRSIHPELHDFRLSVGICPIETEEHLSLRFGNGYSRDHHSVLLVHTVA